MKLAGIEPATSHRANSREFRQRALYRRATASGKEPLAVPLKRDSDYHQVIPNREDDCVIVAFLILEN